MLFDAHTALGHWPFRQVPGSTASELRRLLTAHGIGGAAVVNTHGLFYKNCHDANLELAQWLSEHADFFVGIATLNPTYAAWERDLRTCREKLGFAALRLVPQYHDYALGDGTCRSIVQAATDLGMAIVIPHRVEDLRQRHWMDTDRVNEGREIAALAQAFPQARFLVTEYYLSARMVKAGSDPLVACPNVSIDCTRTALADLPTEFVAQRVLFGTGAPFKSVSPALLKYQQASANLSDAQQHRLACQNALCLLGDVRMNDRSRS